MLVKFRHAGSAIILAIRQIVVPTLSVLTVRSWGTLRIYVISPLIAASVRTLVTMLRIVHSLGVVLRCLALLCLSLLLLLLTRLTIIVIYLHSHMALWTRIILHRNLLRTRAWLLTNPHFLRSFRTRFSWTYLRSFSNLPNPSFRVRLHTSLMIFRPCASVFTVHPASFS